MCQGKHWDAKEEPHSTIFTASLLRPEQDFNMNYNLQLENNDFVVLNDIEIVSYQESSNGHYWILDGISFICKW